MIVVEGMDNTGKSTLVTSIAEHLRLVQVRNNVKHPQTSVGVRGYSMACYDFSKRLGGRVIFDRWPLVSEPIYGTIIRGDSAVSVEDALEMARLNDTAHRVLYVYCRPPEAVIEDWKGREQMEGVISHSAALLRAYDEYFERLDSPVVKYDYTADRLEDLTNFIKGHHAL